LTPQAAASKAGRTPRGGNAPIAIAGNAILVPAGGPSVFGPKGGSPQLVVYTVR
jgi:hypothetical protein